ncbi:MAG: hypothetical protein ACHQAX_09040 [Gammaproteobacteria bacterium]
MVSLISTPWVWYLKVKHRLFGLMPLQGLVNKYHQDETNRDPLWTYWIFLTYEAEVTEAIQKAREGKDEAAADAAEKGAYLAISSALRDPNSPHNVKWRVFLHLLGLVVLSFLMVGIAASNTMSLRGFLGANGVEFGVYTNIVTGFVYTASVWAQWMIYRIGVPKMLKNIGGLDFFETRQLELDSDNNYTLKHKQLAKEINAVNKIKASDLDGYWKRRLLSVFYASCTLACAFAWGVVVYSKLSVGLDASAEGYIGMSTALASDWGLLFGSVAGFAAAFLWLTALRAEMKADEKLARIKKIIDTLENRQSRTAEEEAELVNQRREMENAKKPSRPILLQLLIATTLYALLASMLGQSAIVFDTMGWENANHNPLDPRHPQGLAYYGIYLSAIFIGRMRFSINAMITFFENSKLTLEATTTDKIGREFNEYRSNYVVGFSTIMAVVAFFAASLKVEELRKPLTNGLNDHPMISPMGIMVLGAVFFWTMFLIAKRYKDGTPDEADHKEAVRETNTAWFSSGAAKGSLKPTVNGLLAAVTNGGAFGAIAGGGVQGTISDIGDATGSGDKDWVEPTGKVFASLAQPTSGLQSFTVAMAPVRLNKPKR